MGYSCLKGPDIAPGEFLAERQSYPQVIDGVSAHDSIEAGRFRAKGNTVHLGKTGTATDFLPLEIGWLSQRFAALSEQCWG